MCESFLLLHSVRENKGALALAALIAVIRMHWHSQCDGASPQGDSACKVPLRACF